MDVDAALDLQHRSMNALLSGDREPSSTVQIHGAVKPSR